MDKSKILILTNLVVALLVNSCFINSTLTSEHEFVLEEIGHIPVSGYANDVYADEDIVYLIDFTEGFLIYDISELANPTLLGSYIGYNNLDSNVKGGKTFHIREDCAIVGFMGAGLKILNISDPTNLEVIGEYFGGKIYHIKVIDNYVYMAMSDYGFQIIDISNLADPIKIGEFVNGNDLYHIHVIGNIAYLRDYDQDKTLCLNVTDPANITEITQFDWAAYRITMDDNIGYLSSINGGVLVYDFNEPTNPIFLEEYYDGGDTSDIAIVDDYAFVADIDDGLEILNISDPTNLVEIAQFDDGGRARNIHVQGNRAYISEFEDGLEIIQLWDEETKNTDSISSNNQISSFDFMLIIPVIIVLRSIKRKKSNKNK